MAKIQTVGSISQFMSNDWKQPKGFNKDLEVIVKVIAASGAVTTVILPKAVFAASVKGTFGNIHESIMHGFDAGVVLVIIFAGAAWGFGHRTKAIEILIGVCCGYILARHAVDIRDFLKSI
jgi:hypothetical protein